MRFTDLTLLVPRGSLPALRRELDEREVPVWALLVAQIAAPADEVELRASRLGGVAERARRRRGANFRRRHELTVSTMGAHLPADHLIALRLPLGRRRPRCGCPVGDHTGNRNGFRPPLKG